MLYFNGCDQLSSSFNLYSAKNAEAHKNTAAVWHTSPHTAHVHTPYVMLPHHHIDFLHF